jgi:ubiquinone/menaquinone biosynthesis C-methylase UbiE
MAADYAADNSENVSNSLYERPATIELIGEVKGLEVLDAGCGAGSLTSWLVEHGATVTAFDVSPSMVALARQRVEDQATLLVADLAEPLSFAETGRFDLVVASLAMHYVRDWVQVLKEFKRVLKTDGSVVFSTHHPTMDARIHSPENYFAIKQVTEEWEKGTGTYEVTFWRRPLTAMSEAISEAGFVIERLVEPMPVEEAAAKDPAVYAAFTSQPGFLFFRLQPGI